MKLFEQQLWHILILFFLLCGLYFYTSLAPTSLDGDLLGIKTSIWFILACLSPIVHQIYVVVCWRSEFYYKSISNRFGARGFKLYKIGFVILILSRLVTILILAISNENSIQIDIAHRYLAAIILLIPSVYLFYSVKKYFGMNRAFGLDHFYPEEVKKIPFVKEGIFKYTSNGMYTFGFLILWVPGILLASKAALSVALFSHLYIWVHYFFTELPDIKVIYKK